MKLRLEQPNINHKTRYLEMIKKWGEIENIPTSPSRLFSFNDYETFLNDIIKDMTNSSLGVNAHLFFLVDSDNNILGAIQIRHHINHPILQETGGHIGYGITPEYRKKGYATEMLRLGLIEAKKLGLKEVLITCDVDNIGSSKVIEKNGGLFESFTSNGEKKRYWIRL